MSTVQQLDNTGFAILGRAPKLQSQEPRTLIVLGAPRGGTSAIASILQELGVFLGDNATAPVYEDLELASRLEREGEESASAKIEDYNQRHKVWGYKRPGLAFTIDQHHKLFRNPIYLAVFRDLFATANRNLISSHIKNPLVEKMQRIQGSYAHILSFLDQQQPCMLACSYEKLLLNPAGYVDFLLEQAGLSVSAEQRAAAIRCIEPQPISYLQHARADRCHGAIDGIEAGHVRGWARYCSRFVRRPVELDVMLEQVKIGRCTANLPQFKNCSFDEDPADACAFEFELPAGSHGQLSVRASHEQTDIDVRPVVIADSASGAPPWQRLLRFFR
jgi:hypothetical protein